MALLDLVHATDDMRNLRLKVAALHVDYATRGEDSTRDRCIVADACAVAGVRLHEVRLKGGLHGGNFQARARALRYDHARGLAAAEGYDVVVTAHNRDDQAETVLYRLAKYASPRGLVGMPPRDGDLARPLLCLSAAEIRDYCRACGIEYGVDVTNEQRRYARNRIRLDVLPVLERINPRVAETLAAGAEMAEVEAEVLAAAARDASARVLLSPDVADVAVVDLERLALEPPALQALVLHEFVCSALGGDALVERRAVNALLALARRPDDVGRVALRGGLEAVRAGGRLRLRRRVPVHSCAPAGVDLRDVVAAEGEGVALDWCGRRFRLRLERGAPRLFDPAQAWLAVSTGVRRVVLRHPVRGDRFAPLGVGGATTVARFLAGARASRDERAGAVVVAVDDAVAWVGYVAGAGVKKGRVAESFRGHESTLFALHVFEDDTLNHPSPKCLCRATSSPPGSTSWPPASRTTMKARSCSWWVCSRARCSSWPTWRAASMCP
jgi:tRNA(Ile)-lysidine synthase